MTYEEPIQITPKNYKFFDQLGREVDLSSIDEQSFLFEIKMLMDAYILKRLRKEQI